MKLEDAIEILTKCILSENQNLEFVFTFTTQQTGNIVAYDKHLQVSITGEWKIILENTQVFIMINGFDGLRNEKLGFKCEIENLEKVLKSQSFAYDLAGQ